MRKNASKAELRQWLAYISKGFAANLAAHRVLSYHNIDERDDATLCRMIDAVDRGVAQLEKRLKTPKG